ncbi:xanthine dehydrogenase, molybdenum binding subunit apoprotein [Enhydrobacter aerosaccus]|uniref:Xanthine dehydrogenase, molybdenum binding subunit apoprotein n=1 Tax=Enhydrobacter aerosaccus TaxID=225324 RepID=A0A1T4RCA6_9HYPH|nr:xanthine dehydrogenase molybdopterin binding subunit [Enhydrobacter aerosaccus]SKA13221.1 xanthine dehydrogenase, molybdenum binding subunit apoprotein [Enhydrobacter aerosaccus]
MTVHTSRRHDSAFKHVTGQALYIDDMPEPAGTLHAALILSPVAAGRLRTLDLSAVSTAPDVVAVIGPADIPGQNDVAPVGQNEPLFAVDQVSYAGQPLALVAARTLDAARRAAERATIDIAAAEPVLDIETALARQEYVQAPSTLLRGDPEQALKSAPHKLSAEFTVGGQEHFYLEGQIAFALPGEDGDIVVHSSTQHPTEVQHICARLLGCDFNRITAVVRRLGGGFGGKESNASWVAGAAALAASHTGRPVKLRLPREIDMIATGKRHPFLYRYTVGFDDDGRVLALDAMLAADAGWSLDLTPGVMARALTHTDNAYWIPHFRAVGYACRTNKQSNTAFRGFGGPQGVVVMEDALDRIARRLGRDPDAVRALNFYGGENDETPYGQKVEQNHLSRVWAELRRDAGIEQRRAEIDAFNRTSTVLKRGLGLFPLKFGISFNIPHMNQAGALVHVYTDGSIRLNHGGTEMGQGLFTKVAQVVAEVFKVDIDRIRASATSTAEVPNTSPTAASTGSDLNGWAAYEAANTIKQRMTNFAADHFGVAPGDIAFADGTVRIAKPGSNQVLSFGELVRLCYLGRVSLSSTGYYKTPKIHWDGVAMRGRPFFYYSYGAAAAEVVIDTLTGESRVLRADLVQDCGASLNPAIDLGQIEGAFVQGQGWFTCEELWWDAAGRLRTVGPSTYKIPGSRDAPKVFNVKLLENAPSQEATIFRSKAVGEPPLMLATAVWNALKDAVAAAGDSRIAVRLDAPATPERILAALARVRST